MVSAGEVLREEGAPPLLDIKLLGELCKLPEWGPDQTVFQQPSPFSLVRRKF